MTSESTTAEQGAPVQAAEATITETTKAALANARTHPIVDEAAKNEKQGRDKATGQYAGKERLTGPRMDQIARDSIRKHMGLPNGEKDLAKVAPKKPLDNAGGKGDGDSAKTDPAPESDGTTEKAKPERTSLEATRARRKADKALSAAQQALELEGWTEEELANLPDNRVLALGRRAKDIQSVRGRELRGKTSERPSEREHDDDGDEPQEVEPERPRNGNGRKSTTASIAKKHFGEFNGGEAFSEKLDAYMSDVLAARDAQHREDLSKVRGQIREEMRAEAEFDAVCKELATDFPQLATPDGQDQILRDLKESTRRHESMRAAVRYHSNANWADELRTSTKKKAEADKQSSARERGQPVVTNRAGAPAQPTEKDVILGAVRKHITERTG